MYICTKAMKLGGEAYIPGDPVSGDVIAPGRAGKLIACGYIAESETGKPASAKVETKENKVETKEIKAETKETETVEKVEEAKTKKKKKEV